jgi:regulator of sirC expression with transglutaminase-like and TPR domain
VGLPGHFIVRVDGTDEELMLDPFHCGRMLSLADCQRRLDRIFDRRVSLEPDMLLPCGERQILTRMLYNLKGIYVQAQDHWRALGVVELLLRLEPGDAEELRDRGLLYAALDCYGLAVLDLEAYLGRGRQPDASTLRETLADLRARQARVN